MFRSLAAGAKVELCFRCEARSLLTNPSIRSFSSSLRRKQVSQQADVDHSSDLPNVHNTSPSSNIANDGEKLEQEQSAVSNHSSALSRLGGGIQEPNSPGTSQLRKNKGHRRILLHGASTGNPGQSEGRDNGAEDDRNQIRYPAWRHPDVASDRVELGVERLGEPATIRVLPEGIDRGKPKRKTLQSKNRSTAQDKKPKQDAPTPLEALVETTDSKDDRIAGDAEAFNNIETLRKAFFSGINQFEGATEDECRELGRSLERGFTIRQLRSYSKLAITMKLPEADRLESPLIAERYQVSRWYTGPSRWLHVSMKPEHYFTVSGIKDYHAICHTGKKDKLGYPIQTPAEKEVNHILRLCWGLRSREEKLQKGSVALKINEDWVAMLLQQEKTVFQQVAKLFKVKTKVDTRGLVTISGIYDACVDAVRMITSVIAAARIEQIAIIDEKLNASMASTQTTLLRDMTTSTKEFWEQIGQRTQTRIVPTSVEPNGSYRKVNVFYLSNNIETLSTVKRWISYIQKILKERAFPCYSTPESSQTFPSLVPIPTVPSMALVDQHSHWYRWQSLPPMSTSKKTSPPASMKRKDSSLPHAKDPQSIQISDKLLESWEKVRKQVKKSVKQPARSSKYWQPQPQTSLIATFGHLVHAISDKKLTVLQKDIDNSLKIKGAGSVAVARTIQKLFSFRRIMTTGIPSLMDILAGLDLNKPALSSFFRIVLMPSSITRLMPLQSSSWGMPSLEIDVGINDLAKTTSLRQVRLVLDKNHADLALPELAADIRFAADTSILGREDNSDPAITNFIEGCDLDIWGTGQFRTPSTLTLTLPLSMLQPSTEWTRIETSLAGTSQDTGTEPADILSKVADNVDKLSKTSEQLVADSEAVTMQDVHIDRPSEAADRENHLIEHNSIDDATKGQNSLSVADAEASFPDRQSVSKAERVAAQQVQVVYTFDSLAVHSMVRSPYQEATLAFSTIESGQIGGKQHILQMQAPGIADILVRGEGDRPRELSKTVKAKFMAFYGSLSEFISRLPK